LAIKHHLKYSIQINQTLMHFRFELAIAAASDTVGEVYFDDSDPFSGLASHQAFEQATYKVPAVTIDSICQQEQLAPPYLIKLDTHGFEVPIFEGAKESLKQTSLIVVEVYNFNLTSDSLRFPQLCQYLEDQGFQCIDMCDPMFREKDGSLWQFDLFFIPKKHPVFLDNSWT
jgi:FkbM family methyltransferase